MKSHHYPEARNHVLRSRCSRFQNPGEGEKQARAIVITNNLCRAATSLLPLLPASSQPGILRHVQSGRCWPSALHTRHSMTILWSTRSSQEKPYKALYGISQWKEESVFQWASPCKLTCALSISTPLFIGSWILDETQSISNVWKGAGVNS